MEAHTSTRVGQRINEVYDEIRKMYPHTQADTLEMEQEEILLVLIMIKEEMRKWGGDKRARYPRYKEGAIYEVVGGDYEALMEVARMYTSDFSRLLT